MWKRILKQSISWNSNDKFADGEATLVNKYGEPQWEIISFGVKETGKGLGEKYLREFILFLESKERTDDLVLIDMPVGDAITFWERMEEKGLVIV